MKTVVLYVSLMMIACALTDLSGQQQKPQQKPKQHGVLSGIISKIDRTAKTIAIKTKDGAEVVVSETAETARQGGAAVKEGAQAVVHYSGDGLSNTAHTIKNVGATLQETQVTVTKVDRTARTVTAKTAQGAEQVYSIAQDGVVSTGTTAVHAAADLYDHLERAAKSGAKVTLHHTEEAGRKVVHAFRHDS